MATDTLTINGTYTYSAAPGGPEVTEVFGAPVVTPTSSAATLDYNESSGNVIVLSPSAVQVINFGTIADADWLYIGTDQAVTVKFNGSSDAISLGIGGMIVIYKGSITAMTVTCSTVSAKVKYLLLGD